MEKDAQEISRDLQRQLGEIQNIREQERHEFVEKLNQQRSEADTEIKTLKERTVMVGQSFVKQKY